MTTTTIASLSPDDPLAASFSENYPSVAAYLENDLSIEALRRGLKARLGWRSGGLRQIVVILENACASARAVITVRATSISVRHEEFERQAYRSAGAIHPDRAVYTHLTAKRSRAADVSVFLGALKRLIRETGDRALGLAA